MLDYLDKITKPLVSLPTRDRLEYLIELGQELDKLDQQHITDKNKVPGCISNVYMIAEQKDDKITFKAQADALIVKGYVAILIKALSGHTAKEIIEAEDRIKQFIEEAKVNASLTPSRANAFANVYAYMKNLVSKLE